MRNKPELEDGYVTKDAENAPIPEPDEELYNSAFCSSVNGNFYEENTDFFIKPRIREKKRGNR